MTRSAKTVAALFTAVSLSACSYASMGPGEQGVVQDGYWMIPTDPALVGCIAPERSQNEITNEVYRYPARQISWDATGDPGSERGPYVVVSSAKAPADVNVPVVVTFDLTTDCEKLKQFHRDFGTKYSGWLNEDGTVSLGWTELLNYVVGQPLQDTLNAVAQNYTWKEIWNDDSVRSKFRDALTKSLPGASKARTDNTEFFTNFQVTVLKPTPVNPELKAAIEREQAAVQNAQATQAQGVAEANAKTAKAEADIKAAEAETRVAEQEALKRAAELKGYPTPDDYLRALAIEQGLNPYQPTYVVPQGG
jgi:regulator of protease activity HflC (stomatin/prohibitin superfamily)